VRDRLPGREAPGPPRRLLRGLAAVCFSPDDLLLVKGGPEGRDASWTAPPSTGGRRFSPRPGVLRALRERNAALRTASPEVEQSFRTPLVRAAARLLVRRQALVRELAPRVATAFAEIAAGRSRGAARLPPRLGHAGRGDEPPCATGWRRSWRSGWRGTATGLHLGRSPHGRPDPRPRRARRAPLREPRPAAGARLALKIAEIENLRRRWGDPATPARRRVSELDPDKNRYLLRYLGMLPAQAVLTTPIAACSRAPPARTRSFTGSRRRGLSATFLSTQRACAAQGCCRTGCALLYEMAHNSLEILEKRARYPLESVEKSRPRSGERKRGTRGIRHRRHQGLEGLEAVRKRPHMYIGDVGERACITWCTRWSTTPSTRPWPPRRRDQRLHPRRQLHHRPRQRSGSRWAAPHRGGHGHARRGDDQAPRRRQVRVERLQGVGASTAWASPA